MKNKVKTITLFLISIFILAFSTDTTGQEMDTIALKINDMLIMADTVYYGIQDSIVIVPAESRYRKTRNRMLRNEEYYGNSDEKLERAKAVHQEYMQLWKSQYVKHEQPIDFSEASQPFEEFKGKKIRNITIIQVDILEGDVYDTSKTSISKLSIRLNNGHISTRKNVIKRNIKFKVNDVVDARIISDNERLIRQLPFIEDAKISIIPVSLISDTVDVLVVTKDNIPYGLSGDVRDYNYFIVEPYTQNFLGQGHKLGVSCLFKGNEDPMFGYGATYRIDNVFGVFTNAKAEYSNTFQSEYFRTNVDKPFVSTNTKYGGELAYEYLATTMGVVYHTPDSSFVEEYFFRKNTYLAWFGRSFFFSENLNKAFINTAFSYTLENYTEHPFIQADSNFTFHNKELALAAITLQRVRYVKATKLLGYGVVEDIPIGYYLQLNGGISKSNYLTRPYVGLFYDYTVLSNRKSLFSLNLSMGSFFHQSKPQDRYQTVNVAYASPLIDLQPFELRNLFSLTISSLNNPLYYREIDFSGEIRDLDQFGVYGRTSLVLRYQPVFYTSLQAVGFKFSFNPFVDMGWLSKKEYFEGKKQFYAAYGLSLSTKNESLTLPALSLHVGYYPNWREQKNKVRFKVTFTDYKILNQLNSMKPKVVKPSSYY